MKKRYTYLYLALSTLAISLASCADSAVDSMFTPSMEDRVAVFSLYASPGSFQLESGSSSQSFTVSSTDNWVVSAGASWISFSNTSGNGNGSVTFNVQENASDSERSGYITVSGVQSGLTQNITVTQKGLSLSLGEQSLEFEYGGGTKTVEVHSDGHFSVKNDADWLSCEPSATSVKITALPNSEMSPRTAVVQISLDNSSLSKSVEVTQYGVSGIVIGGFDDDNDW